jgi:hypothetical protein
MSNAKPIKLKVNVTRVLKEHLYAGKNGKYLDLVAWPNKNGPDQYGNTHFVCQEISREARDRGERGPIIGNLTLPEPEQRPPARTEAARRAESHEESQAGFEEDDIPFN